MEELLKKSDATLTLEERDELIRHYASLVKYIAQRIAVRLPANVELDDLVNAGITGLMDAIDKYDSRKNIKFRTYAEFRIRGAILDELRTMDWIPRSLRQKSNRLERAYTQVEQEKGRAATDEEVAKVLGVDMVKLRQLLGEVGSVSLINPEDLEKTIPGLMNPNAAHEVLAESNQHDPVEVFNAQQLRDVLAQAIDELPEKERIVLSLYYYEELTMKKIGQVLSITESRVSQIHTKALSRLKGKVKKIMELDRALT